MKRSNNKQTNNNNKRVSTTPNLSRIYGLLFFFFFSFFLVTFVLVLLYVCEIWTLLANSEKRKGKKKGGGGDPGFRNQVPEETSPHPLLAEQDQRLGAEQDKLPCGSTGISSGNCQETETCMVRACHTPRQPLQNHPLGHLGGWATARSTDGMLDGQHQRVDIPVYARPAHKGLL